MRAATFTGQEKIMSVTTVPIQPIKKGSIAKYWTGVGAVLLAGGALAWWGTSTIRADFATDDQFFAGNADEKGVVTSKSGLQMLTIRGGEGKSPTDDDIVLVSYKGTLRDGTVFDEAPQAPFPVTGVVPGFSEALKKMQLGGKYKVWIPGKLGYGENPPSDPKTGQPAFEPNATLIFDIELLDFRSRAEVEAMQKQMQEQQKKQGGGGAAQGGAQQLPPEIQAQIDQQMQQGQ
jgi:FKBP-type peptidyl-prolyl cis-trans isomerase FkpA